MAALLPDLSGMDQAGHLLLVEVKAGVLSVCEGQLLKDYGARQRDVAA